MHIARYVAAGAQVGAKYFGIFSGNLVEQRFFAGLLLSALSLFRKMPFFEFVNNWHQDVADSRRNSKRSDSLFATNRLSCCKFMMLNSQVRQNSEKIQASLPMWFKSMCCSTRSASPSTLVTHCRFPAKTNRWISTNQACNLAAVMGKFPAFGKTK
jgi:hypothetical protein